MIKNKTDAELLADLKSLRTQEKEVLLEILQHLQEVELRGLALKSGFESLYEYCQTDLGYTKDEAYYRIQALRLMKAVPEVQEQIRSGSVGLTILARAQCAFNQEDRRRKSVQAPVLTAAEKSDFVSTLENQSTRNCERKMAAQFPDQQKVFEKTMPIAARRTMIQLVVDDGLLAQLEVLKGLTSHSNPQNNWEGLIKILVKQGFKKYEKQLGTELCETMVMRQLAALK